MAGGGSGPQRFSEPCLTPGCRGRLATCWSSPVRGRRRRLSSINPCSRPSCRFRGRPLIWSVAPAAEVLRQGRLPLDAQVEGWLLTATRELADGRTDPAREALEHALRLAFAEKMRRPIVEAPPDLRRYDRTAGSPSDTRGSARRSSKPGLVRRPPVPPGTSSPPVRAARRSRRSSSASPRGSVLHRGDRPRNVRVGQHDQDPRTGSPA